jgi:glutathione peroxidase-family protein
MANFHELKINALNGTPANLAQFKGKVVLAVNVASA